MITWVEMTIHWIQADIVSADQQVEQEEVAVAQQTTLIVLSSIEIVVTLFHGINLKEFSVCQ